MLRLAAAACVLAAMPDRALASKAEKLNLLMILSDQHRWDCLGEAGNPIIHTPNLDQLARDGAHFTRAYTVCPVCCPSRTSMLSGAISLTFRSLFSNLSPSFCVSISQFSSHCSHFLSHFALFCAGLTPEQTLVTGNKEMATGPQLHRTICRVGD